MKKLLLLLVAGLVFCTSQIAFSDTVLNVSASKTADALIRTGNANFYGIWLTLDGTNDVTVSVYDGLTNAGTLIFPTTVISASDAVNNSAGCYFNAPIKCSTGLYIDITTSGTVTYQVYYNTKKN